MNKPISNPTAKQSLTAQEIQVWLVSQISEQLGVPPSEIDVEMTLDSYGLDSAQAMIVATKAQKFLGFQLSAMLLWHYPTIESLAQRLAEEAEASESETFEI